jgi:hypothetical protein
MSPHVVTYRAQAGGHNTILSVTWPTRDDAEKHARELREIPCISEVVIDPLIVHLIAQEMSNTRVGR